VYAFEVGKREGSFPSLDNTRYDSERPAEADGAYEEKQSQAIALDQFAEERGWFSSQPDIVVLVVGLEELGYNVILGALGLIRSKMIHNIFMEISARSENEITAHKAALRLMNLAGYTVRKVSSWRGPYELFLFDNSRDLAEQIMEHAQKERTKRLNLQWTL
jgi:hypothetical protein